jgi:hypothetical protein
MKIETQKGVTIIKEFNELILEHRGKQLNVSLTENGFELSLDHFSPVVIDKDLNEIIEERARDMAVVFATKELWMQNPESAFTKGIPTALYNDVADRFDRWDKIKHVSEELCEITVSSDLIPLFCKYPNFTNYAISHRDEPEIIGDILDLDTESKIFDKEFSIEDYLNQ